VYPPDFVRGRADHRGAKPQWRVIDWEEYGHFVTSASFFARGMDGKSVTIGGTGGVMTHGCTSAGVASGQVDDEFEGATGRFHRWSASRNWSPLPAARLETPRRQADGDTAR
jgi:hypothetical protein